MPARQGFQYSPIANQIGIGHGEAQVFEPQDYSDEFLRGQQQKINEAELAKSKKKKYELPEWKGLPIHKKQYDQQAAELTELAGSGATQQEINNAKTKLMNFATESASQRAYADGIWGEMQKDPDIEYGFGQDGVDGDFASYYQAIMDGESDYFKGSTYDEAVAETMGTLSQARIKSSPGDWIENADKYEISSDSYLKELSPDENESDYFVTNQGTYVSNAKLDRAFELLDVSTDKKAIRDKTHLFADARNKLDQFGTTGVSAEEFRRMPDAEKDVLVRQKAEEMYKTKIKDRIATSSKKSIVEAKKKGGGFGFEDKKYNISYSKDKKEFKGEYTPRGHEEGNFEEIGLEMSDVSENKPHNITNPDDPTKGKDTWATPLALRRMEGSDKWTLLIEEARPIIDEETGLQKEDEDGNPSFEKLETREIPFEGAVKGDIAKIYGGDFDPDKWMEAKGISPLGEAKKEEKEGLKVEDIGTVNYQGQVFYTPTTEEEYNLLPSGSYYQDTDKSYKKKK